MFWFHYTKTCNKPGKNGSKILGKLKVLAFRFALLHPDNRRDGCPTVTGIAELEEVNDKFRRRPNPYVGCQAWRAATCALLEPGLRLGPVDSALSPYNVKPGTGTTVLVARLFVVFSVELASHSVGNETLLLKFGALPDDGELHGEYWRLATRRASTLAISGRSELSCWGF